MQIHFLLQDPWKPNWASSSNALDDNGCQPFLFRRPPAVLESAMLRCFPFTTHEAVPEVLLPNAGSKRSGETQLFKHLTPAQPSIQPDGLEIPLTLHSQNGYSFTQEVEIEPPSPGSLENSHNKVGTTGGRAAPLSFPSIDAKQHRHCFCGHYHHTASERQICVPGQTRQLHRGRREA